MPAKVKICGITTAEALQAACTTGADFIGFVFYAPSPRSITPEQAAPLIESLPSHVSSVALFVNPTDDELNMTLRESRTDYIQLHGSETPKRVKMIKERFNLPIIKAIPIHTAEDIKTAYDYEDIVDWLLFDTKSDQHGGTGQSFDWSLLHNKTFKKPVMLSGGLTADNVKEALHMLSPDAVDVSSGVESTKGVKDVAKIVDFINKVKTNG